MATKPFETGYSWQPGRVEVVVPPIRSAPQWAMVYDDGGTLVARFKRGASNLQVSFDPADKPHNKTSWRDATPIWPRFPAWVRGAVTQQLHLFTGVYTSGNLR